MASTVKHQVQIFSTGGSTNFFVPPNVERIRAFLIAGGGKGSGSTSGSGNGGGGGGGSSGYMEKELTVVPGELLTVHPGEAVGSTGDNNSWVKRGSTILIQVDGGKDGAANSGGTQGAGGAAGGGLGGLPGADGGSGSSALVGGTAAAQLTRLAASIVPGTGGGHGLGAGGGGGGGAPSPMASGGNGGAGIAAGAGTSGSAALGYGAGSGGGGGSGSFGGDPSSGYIEFSWEEQAI